jgi:hypothetical protein
MASGQVLSAENTTIWVAGAPVAGVIKFDSEVDETSEDVYVVGQKEPAATMNLKRSIKGTLTLLRTQFDSLQASIPKGKSLTDIEEFQIQHSYLTDGGRVVIDHYNKVKFTNIKKSVEGGGSFKEVPLSWIARGYEPNK